MDLHALVIDPDTAERHVLSDVLRCRSWNVREAGRVEEALSLLDQHRWSLVFCDATLSLQLTDQSNGLTLLGELKGSLGATTKVVITARAGMPVTALEVLLNGASDYIRKPYREQNIVECSRAVIERLRAAELEARNAQRTASVTSTESLPSVSSFVGESDAIIKVFKQLAHIIESVHHDISRCHELVADARLPSVFITGETGTGKELIAQIIHRRSGQSNGQFVPVNCSSLLLDLAESELFGHVAGAFTGALKEKEGLWETASGGTLFLDEITEAPSSVQPKLLRVLQDGQVKRLGSNKWTHTCLQIIAASNRDMQQEIAAGRFRADLYHRLSLHRLHLPPLRERLEDIPLIVDHLMRKHFTRRIDFTDNALDVLMGYDYPGNVRELENIVCGAARKSPEGRVYGADLRSYMELTAKGSALARDSAAKQQIKLAAIRHAAVQPPESENDGLDERLQRYTQRLVQDALAESGGNITRAARKLKISRPRLYKLLAESERLIPLLTVIGSSAFFLNAF